MMCEIIFVIFFIKKMIVYYFINHVNNTLNSS